MRQRLVSSVLVFILSFFFLTSGLATFAGDPIQAVAQELPGFSSQMSYQNMGQNETVAPFNGGLTVVHRSAIGLPGNLGSELRPVRVYNSKDSATVYDEENPYRTDKKFGVLGWGWHLGYGRVFVRFNRIDIHEPEVTSGGNNAYIFKDYAQYFYLDESGAEHRLYTAGGPQLVADWQNHGQWQTPSQSWYLTNDGSYIRAKYLNGIWTIYFPDGSVREAGDATAPANGYAAPEVFYEPPDAALAYRFGLKNPRAHGWYVTKIQDRAGNETRIEYKPNDPTSGYGGVINKLIQNFGTNEQRAIAFTHQTQSYAGQPYLLLHSISSGGRTETFSYDFITETGAANSAYIPVLATVTDPVGLETKYSYDFAQLQQHHRLLTEIRYPTGAVSSYKWQLQWYKAWRKWKPVFGPYYFDGESGSVEERSTLRVISHTVKNRSEQTQAWNILTWKWYRGTYVPPTNPPTMPSVVFVVTVDPLGTEEVRHFSANDYGNAPYPVGTELRTDRRRPGAVSVKDQLADPAFDPRDNPAFNQDVVSTTTKVWESGGGDAEHCWEPNKLSIYRAKYGNMRVAGSTTQELTEGRIGTVPIWSKHVKSSLWDGYGHYGMTVTDGTVKEGGPQGMKVSFVTYLPPDTLPAITAAYRYQTDRVISTVSGGATSITQVTDTCGLKDLLEVREVGAFGLFQAVYQQTDTVTGLPLAILTRKTPLENYTHTPEFCNSPAPANSVPPSLPGDKLLNIEYNAQGNISRLKYSGGDSSATYGFDFTWSYGMVTTMRRDGSPYGNEFTRAIDSNTSLILDNTDPNGLTTSFEYDALNRLTKIVPPNGEYATAIAYPNDTATAGTVHDILFYRGPGKTFPTTMEGFSDAAWVTGLDGGAAYQHYIFDDLGRLVKTRSIHPEGYLTETMTSYDPLGNAFFNSLPYRADTPPTAVPLNWDDKLPDSADYFITTILRNPMENPQVHPYGSVSSFFVDSYWPSSATSSMVQLIQGDHDPFDRPVWVFKPDGTKTQTTYTGLKTEVTLFDIQGLNSLGNPILKNSTTTYYKDLWGRLTQAVPPEGTDAVYTYNGLDQLKKVDLSGQIRSFTYDALGRILTANNPENGLTTYLGYDCIGNLLAARDANGADATRTGGTYRLVNTYDPLGRLETTTQDFDGATSDRLLLHNTYDFFTSNVLLGLSKGKLIQAESWTPQPDGSLPMASLFIRYDGLNGRPSEVQSYSDAAGNLVGGTVNLAYDHYGQLTSQTLPEAGGIIQNTYFHGAMVMRTQVDSNGNPSPLIPYISYTAAGSLAAIGTISGMTMQTAYDAFERAKGFALMGAGMVWGNGSYQGSPYAYDGVGNIASIGAENNRMDTFYYDTLSRLVKAVVNGASSPADIHDYRYKYDAWGNLKERSEYQATGRVADTLSQRYFNKQFSVNDPTLKGVEAYVKSVSFTTTMEEVPPAVGLVPGNTVPTNRLKSVKRGGTIGGTDTGLTSTGFVDVVYDANGNMIDDGIYTYAYDALNRQTGVKSKATNAWVSLFVYDAAGERVAKVDRKPSSTEVAAYTCYVRDGGAVLWEKSWAAGNTTPQKQKSYYYAGGRMALTKESVATALTAATYRQMLLVTGSGQASPSLSEPIFTYFSANTHAGLGYYIENLGADVQSFTVRVARVQPSAGHANGNANSHANEQPIFEQTIEKPEYGWPSEGAFVSFPDLLTGWQYQVSLTIQTTLGSLPILGPHPVTVEEGSVSVPRSATSPHAWTMHRWVADGASNVADALAVGWRNVAPEGSGLYTLSVMQDGQSVPLTTSPVSGESILILGGSTSFNWCDSSSSTRDITIQDLGSNTTTGIVPPRPDPDLCVDPISGLSYATSWSTYATDHLGTVRAVVTDNQDGTSSIQKFDYEPFGVELFNPANVGCGNTHKFTGHERDAETGNDYMHFRYFSASMGRFQKPDSISDGAAANPQGWNLYTYVKGNPVNFNDPTGHMSVEAGRRVAEGEYIDPYNTTEHVAASLGGVPDTEKGEGITRDEKKQGKVQTKPTSTKGQAPASPLAANTGATNENIPIPDAIRIIDVDGSTRDVSVGKDSDAKDAKGMVDKRLVFEFIKVVAAGGPDVTSVWVSSARGGQHSGPEHPAGKALDFSRINGIFMRDMIQQTSWGYTINNDVLWKMQLAALESHTLKKNFGPAMNSKAGTLGQVGAWGKRSNGEDMYSYVARTHLKPAHIHLSL